ncbi:MAG: hypothetical protein LBC19_11355 [Tannerella sp.]|jgi:hypothetical protein|nr:hypothetical protein [Tannerella sp.]
MKKYSVISICIACFAYVLLTFTVSAQVKSWEGIHRTPLADVRNNFASPPVEFAGHVIWGWEGAMDIKSIRKDLDSMYSRGFRSVIFEAGYNLPFEYLSDEWFTTVASAVREAKKRGMKVWIIDEGKYPSGFAGGKFTRERPDLRMQALVVCDTIHVKAGQTLVNCDIDTFAVSAVAVNTAGLPDRIVEIADHKISFNACSLAFPALCASNADTFSSNGFVAAVIESLMSF